MTKYDPVASAILGTLSSPNETDQNGEAANAVDGLFAIARALEHIGRAIDGLTENALCSYEVGQALKGLSRISELADRIDEVQ